MKAIVRMLENKPGGIIEIDFDSNLPPVVYPVTEIKLDVPAAWIIPINDLAIHPLGQPDLKLVKKNNGAESAGGVCGNKES